MSDLRTVVGSLPLHHCDDDYGVCVRTGGDPGAERYGDTCPLCRFGNISPHR